MQITELETQRLSALRRIASGTLRLKWLRDATRFERAACRYGLALKAGFKQDQPRFPKGAPNGPGRWSGGPGTSGSGGAGGKAPSEEPPEEKPPTSRERTSILKEVARRIQRTGETIVAVAKMGTWIVTYSAHINAYNDPPKSLEELQRGASTPAAGYDIHHIVEQTPAERDGFSRDVIDGPDNLVRVPRLKHQEINGWYQRPNADYGWQTPREYLSGRNWEVRRSVGLQALKIHGVLKP